MTTRRIVLLIVLAAGLGAAGFYRVRNPERNQLDAAARATTQGQFVTLTNGVTHYDVAGPDTGQRVILVHGFSVPSYIWDSTVVALTGAGFRVARYDMFGRGFSDRPRIRYRQEVLIGQLAELLDSLRWREPVDVVGLSMGGPVSAGFTGTRPNRVRSLTLIDPAAGPPTQLSAMFRLPVLGAVLW